VKNVRTIWLVAVVLFLSACPSLGTIQFRDGRTHDINYRINDNVWVDYGAPYMYTTVNVLDGGDIPMGYSLLGYENSQINIRGGYTYWLRSYNSSHVNISRGHVHYLGTNDSSHVNISGGGIDYGLGSSGSSEINVYSGWVDDYLDTYDSSQLNIFGGSVEWLNSNNSSQINIYGGSVEALNSWESSQVNMSGGSVASGFRSYDSSQVNIKSGSIRSGLNSSGSSQVNISGGSIGGELQLSWQSIITVYGSNFAVDGQPFGYGEITSILGGSPWDEPLRHLTGTLLSSELINNDFRIGYDARIVLIPEPASAITLGLGGLFFVLRCRRQ